MTRPAAGETPRSRRTRLRAAAFSARAQEIADRAQTERSRHASLDAVFAIVDRDVEVGGGIISGALAYRWFIWLLPFALVGVAGLGFAADAASKSPKDAAATLGLAGLVGQSVATTSEGSTRWYALLVGVPALLLATRSCLRALIGTHRLAWTDLRARAPRPTMRATLVLLLEIVLMLVLSALASAARAHSVRWGIVSSILVSAAYAGVWLLVSLRLPHRSAPWQALLPGAAVFGVGAMLVQVVAAYAIAPLALSKQGTYGAMGLAATVLLGLFVLGRLMIGAAVVNATLAERRTGG